jgi:hypothetical protein
MRFPGGVSLKRSRPNPTGPSMEFNLPATEPEGGTRASTVLKSRFSIM